MLLRMAWSRGTGVQTNTSESGLAYADNADLAEEIVKEKTQKVY
jgi:hypothetical protein